MASNSFLTPADWHSWFTHQATWTRATRRWLYEQANLPAAHTVLEVGCGTGVIAGEVARMGPAITGLDLSAGMLAVARRVAPTVRYVQGDAHALPFPDGTFDLVLCHYLLLWLADPARGLCEMARVVRPGGVVLACAEPDYGGRVDHPPALVHLGQLQAEALRRQGADPALGRRLGELFAAAGLDATVGVMAGQWARPTPEAIAAEWAMRAHDLAGLLPAEELTRLEEVDRAAAAAGQRVLFVPTFYAWGKRPPGVRAPARAGEAPAAHLPGAPTANLRPVRPDEYTDFIWMVLQTLGDGDLAVAAILRSRFLTRWARRYLRRFYRRAARPFILEVAGTTAGFLVLRQVKQALVIEAIGVLAAFRQQGWGTWLLEQATQEARRLGLARLELHVSSGNRPAQALYAKAGFHPVPRTWSGFHMERLLSAQPEE